MMVTMAKWIVAITLLCATVQGSPHKPLKGRNLVIVFDTTWSMKNDLKEFRAGAEYIVKEMAKKESSPISNYVFAPFHDPSECNEAYRWDFCQGSHLFAQQWRSSVPGSNLKALFL